MAIILEGPDLSGKTTLASLLKNKHDFRIHKHRIQELGARASFLACMKLKIGYTVWDRWWPSEWIYNKLFRKDTPFTASQLWQMGMCMQVKGAVLHILDTYNLKKRYNKRGDARFSYEDILRIKFEYQNYLELVIPLR